MVEHETMAEIKWWLDILDDYLNERYPDIDRDSEPFNNYLESAEYILEHSNFIMFPTEMETNRSKDDTKDRRIFKCDLIVNDMSFWTWIKHYKITFDYSILQNFESLRWFLEKQVPLITIKAPERNDKENFREHFRLWLLAWYDAIFWLRTSYNVSRIWFDEWDQNHFIFNNGVLDIQTKKFTPWEYKIAGNTSINISYPLELMENLKLEESLVDILSIKKYISSKNSISSISVGHLVAWIFRNEYKSKYNEFPFLGIQAISGAGKTSILNFLSRVCWFDWESIEGTWNSWFASTAWMNSTGQRYYFFDEIQQLPNAILKSIQAAYNSGKSYKWWKWNWRELSERNKDCNLICTGEHLPQDEEALLNRFIILDSKETFPIVKNIKDEEEFKKYEEITGERPTGDFLDTGKIKVLATQYYRPRFLNILKHKEDINFDEYVDKAIQYIDYVVQHFDKDKLPGERIINNLIPAISWYLLLCWDDIDEEEILTIIGEYFNNFREYRKEVYISGRAQEYIINNITEFCNWIPKVKYGENNPMIYLKYSTREQWLVMQFRPISNYVKNKLESPLSVAIIEQQLRGFLSVKDKSRAIKVAKWYGNNISWVFIPLDIVKRIDPLKEIRDAVLDFQGTHAKDLQKLKDDTHQSYVMDNIALWGLIEEMEETYEKAHFFDTSSYSKENTEIEQLPF